MPWSEVIQNVSESTCFEPEDVKVVLDAVKELATEEVNVGRVFYFPGLATFRVDTKPRVVATVCEGKAWNRISVYVLGRR